MADEVHFIRYFYPENYFDFLQFFFYPENYKYSIFPTGYFERQENIKQQEKTVDIQTKRYYKLN